MSADRSGFDEFRDAVHELTDQIKATIVPPMERLLDRLARIFPPKDNP